MHFLSYVLIFFSLPAFSAEVVDDVGKRIFLEKPAKRIVSLAPDITEILYAIGAGSQLVGVIEGSDYPKVALKLPKVGSYLGLDLERLLALSPDLVITWGNNFARQLKVLKKIGIPVYTNSPKQLEDVPRVMLNLGELSGKYQQAKLVADDFLNQLVFLRRTYEDKPPIKVFFQVGSYSLLTINKDSWINQAITLCGGRNVFAQALTTTPTVNWEAMVNANPEVVFNAASDDNWRINWLKWPQITAVSKNRLWRIPPDWIERAGPRLIQGTKCLCLNLQMARKNLSPHNDSLGENKPTLN